MPRKRSNETPDEQRERKRLAQQARRSDPEYRERELERQASARRVRITDPAYREQVRERNTAAQQRRRENPVTQENDRLSAIVTQTNRRSDPETRRNEQALNTQAHRERRSNPDTRENERAVDAQARRERRSNPETRQNEQAVNTQARRELRSNPETRQNEQAVNTQARRVLRSNTAARENEQEANTQAHRERRADPGIRDRERVHDALARQERRQDPDVRAQEQVSDTIAYRARLAIPQVRSEINQRASAARRENRENTPWSRAYEKFRIAVQEGPIHTCYSCDRLFFKLSIRITSKDIILGKPNTRCTEEWLEQAILAEHYQKPEWSFCKTCHTSIVKKVVPRLNANFRNLKFPPIDPTVAALKPLERRLVSPRIPFMKIFALGCDRQFGIRGGIVNVPVNVPSMFNAIPINPNQANVVHLKLKRKTIYQSDYMYERIRPKLVYEAAKKLCDTPLYKDHEPPIALQENWALRNNMLAPFDAECDPETAQNIQSLLRTEQQQETDNEIPMEVDEDPQENISMETDEPQVHPAEVNEAEDFTHYDEETMIDSNQAVAFAPGEGEIPLPMWLDEKCEELAFPHIFGGHPRDVVVKLGRYDRPLSYNEIVNSELRRTDRRAAEPDHLLFAHKKSQLKQLSDGINIQMKKAAQNGLTAGNARQEGFVSDIIAKDNAYRTLQAITGSPAYWENQKKNVLAMVRQFGIPTFFVTLSAAETKWVDLLRILLQTVDKVDTTDMTDEEIENLSFEKKAELIRKDPITCALYFDNRFKEVKRTWFAAGGPFGRYKIKHTYHRIEFQHRGSPHVHMMIWLEEAPQYDPNNTENIEEIVAFIDSIISTDSEDPDIQQFIPYQTHRCTKTCRKNRRGVARCRFGAPFPPMKKTVILTPLDDDTTAEEKAKLKELVDKLNLLLDSKTVNTFEELLQKLDCDEETYIKAVRSSINVNKIFLKRAVKDHRINPYSKKILMCMQSNMDIQFILDPYACINYIVEYINKPARGISRLLKECVENLRAGNSTVHHQLKCVCNCFYNGSEICAQEAAWCRCGLKMSGCSVAVQFINTSKTENRHRMLKSRYHLNKLPENSMDVFETGMIDRYAKRPEEMESVCLADFIAEYSFNGKGRSTRGGEDGDDAEDGEDGEDAEYDENNENQVDVDADPEIENEIQTPRRTKQPKIQLEDGGTLTKRKDDKRKVIRFVRFDYRKNPAEFFRERVMLFKPWRNEQTEVENAVAEEVFNQHKDLIMETAKKYIKLDINLDEILQQIEEVREAEETDTWNDEVNPDHVNEYEPNENVPESNILFDVGRERNIQVEAKKYSLPKMLDSDDYLNLCNSLNEKQKDYLMHIISAVKTSDEPQYHFVTGGAGVGKSRLIHAIYQSLMRYYNRDAGPAGKVQVGLIAPTGKAAHGIGGETAHHFFGLKFGTDGNAEKFVPPSAEKLNTMRTELAELKVIIIDEISMMGYATLQKIHLTMNAVYRNSNEDRIFGGRTVIVFGDFNQLQPVKDTFCFIQSSKNPLNVLAGNIIWKNFKMFQLTEIMRQREDTAFAHALNRLAIGTSTDEDMTMFNQHVYTENTLPQEGQTALRLCWTNKEVEEYNMRRLRQIRTNNTRYAISKAIDQLPSGISRQERNQIVANLRGRPAVETQGLPEELELLIGAHYMISSNVDVTDGLFNGAIGVLQDFDTNERNKITKVYLEFDDPSIGNRARNSQGSEGQNLIFNQSNVGRNPLWTPIKLSSQSFAVTTKYTNLVTRHQFPMIVAEAITIHKSQGSTFQKVTVKIPEQNKRALIYVALSRATKLENLYMVGKQLKKTHPPKADDNVVKEMNRLRTEASLVPKFNHLRDIPVGCIQIISQNIRSLKKHIDTLRTDPVFNCSNFILLQEIWMGANSDVTDIEIANKNIVARNISSSSGRGNGTIIYGSENQNVVQSMNIDRTNSSLVDITVCRYDNIYIVNIYNGNKATLSHLESALNKIRHFLDTANVVMLGDFNDDIAVEGNKTRRLIQSYGLKCLSHRQNDPHLPTTDEKTAIDGAFGKLRDYNNECYVYESYCSDHKPIVLRLTLKQNQSSHSTGLSQTLNILNV